MSSLPTCASHMLTLAGLEGASCRHLGQGANNELVLASLNNRSAVLKMTRSRGIDRLALEASLLQALCGLHAPRLLSFHLGDGDGPSCLLMEYAPGEHKGKLGEADAAILGHALAKLHALAPQTLPAALPSCTLQESYEQRLYSQLYMCNGKAPMPLYRRMTNLMERLALLLQEPIIAKHRQVLVHGDLIPLNILWQENACTFIDWELARLDYAEWDFCALEKSYASGELSRQAFYRAYGREPELSLYKVVSLLYYANIALWRMVSFYVRQETHQNAEFFLYELEEEMQWLEARLA